MVGRARIDHCCRNDSCHFFRSAGRRFRAAQLYLSAARARNNYCAHSRQLHLHQALLRLQSFLYLRIPDRAFRHAHQECRFGRVHDHAPARLWRAFVFRSHCACTRLRNDQRYAPEPNPNASHLHRRDYCHCDSHRDLHHAGRHQGRHLDRSHSGLDHDHQRGRCAWSALLSHSRRLE